MIQVAQIVLLFTVALGQLPTTQPTTTPHAPRVVEFQPGVRINWSKRQVEVDATVNLRKGAIELFACSPGAREHEAIVRIEARPTHLFQALGLVGLTPGHPIRYNEKTNQIEPANGEPVEIDIRYEQDSQTHVKPIETWMLDARQRKPIERLSWIFTGSVANDEGGVAADFEGTVIALVDFGSSLIGLPERHSDSNEQLWLVPNTAAIPPISTPCELLFRLGPIRLRLERDGTIWVLGRWITQNDLPGLIDKLQQDRPDGRFAVSADPSGPPERTRDLVRRLRQLGIKEDHIRRVRPPTTQPSGHTGPAATPDKPRGSRPSVQPSTHPSDDAP